MEFVEIVQKIMHPKDGMYLRPMMGKVEASKIHPELLPVAQNCWAEDPAERPASKTILKLIHKYHKG